MSALNVIKKQQELFNFTEALDLGTLQETITTTNTLGWEKALDMVQAEYSVQ